MIKYGDNKDKSDQLIESNRIYGFICVTNNVYIIGLIILTYSIFMIEILI